MIILRIFHTVRYLKPVQLYGRVLFRLRRPRPRQLPVLELRAASGEWVRPVAHSESFFPPDRFRFLNEEHTVRGPGDWARVERSALWNYNLHYFDCFTSSKARANRDALLSLADRWINEVPPFSEPAWAPYPTSLRIVNWIKWVLDGGSLPDEHYASLTLQLRFLRRRIEWHLLGNHLLTNAKGLIFGGLFFAGNEAEEWLATGLSILEHELPVQFLKDGGHFERSAMYHSIMLEDLLDLVNLFRVYDREVPSILTETIHRARIWLRAMTHPDGEIVLFNDSAFGIASDPDEIESYAIRLGFPRQESPPQPLTALEETGYYRIQLGPAVLFADAAPIGPDYLPGHGHADTLTFELSLHGQRCIVDSGTSTYDANARRMWERSTAAHNTITVDGLDSSEVWKSFRVARRAKIHFRETLTGMDSVVIRAAHDGYRRVRKAGPHRRSWECAPEGLRLADEVTGAGNHRLEIAFHIHPELTVEDSRNGGFRIIDRGGKHILAIAPDPQLHWTVEQFEYHPRFGVSLVSSKLIGRYEGEIPVRFITRFTWDL